MTLLETVLAGKSRRVTEHVMLKAAAERGSSIAAWEFAFKGKKFGQGAFDKPGKTVLSQSLIFYTSHSFMQT